MTIVYQYNYTAIKQVDKDDKCADMRGANMNRKEKYVYLQSKTICHGGKHQQEKQPDTCITDG